MKFFFILLFLISTIASANIPKNAIVQFNGQYLNLQEAAKRKGVEIVRHNQIMSYKFDNHYYAVTSENTQMIFNNVRITLDFNKTYSDAKIYLDNYLQGLTDRNGSAHLPQIYPEIGSHVIKIIKQDITKKFTFDLKNKSSIACSGKSDFNCILEIES